MKNAAPARKKKSVVTVRCLDLPLVCTRIGSIAGFATVKSQVSVTGDESVARLIKFSTYLTNGRTYDRYPTEQPKLTRRRHAGRSCPGTLSVRTDFRDQASLTDFQVRSRSLKEIPDRLERRRFAVCKAGMDSRPAPSGQPHNEQAGEYCSRN